MPRITLSIAGNQPESLGLLGGCIKQLSLTVFDEAGASQVELAIVEAVTNSIRHADIGDTDIQIHFVVDDAGVTIDLMDKGKPMDPAILESRGNRVNFNPADIQNLPEGGMGLFIIKNYMNEVSYRFENGRNRWKFRKNLHPAAPPAGAASLPAR